MDALGDFYFAHPLWVWLALSAALLAAEVASGSGWLLWPSASAALVGVLSVFLPMTPAVAVLAFAAITIATTLAGRRFLPKAELAAGGDINDPHTRIVGLKGRAATAFGQGEGRVLVDGKEWAAVLEGGGTLDVGAPVEVTGVNGARLTVRQAGPPPPGTP
jgi:membrane protein implicated in regulation of membrane protease activity